MGVSLLATARYCSPLLSTARYCSPLLATARYCSLLLHYSPAALSMVVVQKHKIVLYGSVYGRTMDERTGHIQWVTAHRSLPMFRGLTTVSRVSSLRDTLPVRDTTTQSNRQHVTDSM